MKFKKGKKSQSGEKNDESASSSEANPRGKMRPLTDQDKELISKLRTEVCDIITKYYDRDFNYVRWLRAYNYNYADVLLRLRKHLQYRKVMDLDLMEDRKIDHPVLNQYVPVGLMGPTGINNQVLIIEAAGRGDPQGLLKSLRPMDFTEHRFELLEGALKLMNSLEDETGQQSGIVYVYDLDGLAMDPILLPIVTGPLKTMWIYISDNYPEMISKIIAVNTPSFINVLWKALYPFLPEHTKEKVLICGPGDDWKSKLLEHVKTERLPKFLGGQMDESERLEKLPLPSTKVPQELFWHPANGEPTLEELTTTVVSAGTSTTVDIIVDKVDTDTFLLLYLYCVDEYVMGVYYGDLDSKKSTPVSKLSTFFPCGEVPASTTINRMPLRLREPGRYVLFLSNEAAWIRSVTVRHRMEVVQKESYARFWRNKNDGGE